MNKRITILGIGALGAAALAFGTLGPASAAHTGPTGTAVCDALPAAVTDLAGQATANDAAVASALATLQGTQADLDVAAAGLVTTAVDYVEVTDAGGDVVAAVNALDAASQVFADKLVAENNAMTAWFDAQRTQYLYTVIQSVVGGVQTDLCTEPATTTTTVVEEPTTTTTVAEEPTTTTTLEEPTTTTTLEEPTTTTTLEEPTTTTTLEAPVT